MSAETTKCFLCGAPAERKGYISPDQEPNTVPGWKYDCSGECPPYALGGGTHHHIETFIKKPEDRMLIADFLKRQYDKRGYEEPYFEISFKHLRTLGLVP